MEEQQRWPRDRLNSYRVALTRTLRRITNMILHAYILTLVGHTALSSENNQVNPRLRRLHQRILPDILVSDSTTPP